MSEEIKETKKEPQINYEAIENDIKKLAEEVKRIKIKAETNHLSEQEIIKKSLSAMTPVAKKQSPNDQSATSPLPSYAKSFSPEIQLEIEYLLHMAFNEGITKALIQAEKSNNPAVLDAFHDALAGKLYNELKQRNIL
ncbi:MAG: hypothetical protein ACP5QN_01735 [Minisyncoccia bacterium]